MGDFEKVNNLTNAGNGRPKGSKNKSVEQREQAYIDYLLKSNVQYKLTEELLTRLENGDIRTSELIKAIQMINSYLIRTADKVSEIEVVEAITTREQAESKLAEFKDTLTLLRAVK